MTAKEFLNQPRALKKKMQIKSEQVERLTEVINKTTSVISDSVKGGGNEKDFMIATVIDLKREVEGHKASFDIICKDIRSKLARMENPQYRLLLEARYIWMYEWRDIAALLNKTERHVLKLHQKALADLTYYLDDDAEYRAIKAEVLMELVRKGIITPDTAKAELK